MTRVLLIGAMIGLAACTTAPTEMRYFPADQAPESKLVWPGPPEPARLAYAGELVGEANFRRAEGVQDGAAVRVLRWIAGITGADERTRQLVRPQAGMVDVTGRILVSDAGREAIVVFDESAGTLSIWDEASPGRAFSSPVGIAADGFGGYLVADADLGAVVRLDARGKPTGKLGGDILERPTGLAMDPATGEIFVVDTAAHDIKVLDSDGNLLRTLGRRGVAPGEFNGPTHLSLANGLLYVTDTLNSRVQILTTAGAPVSSVGERGLYIGNLVRPKGVTIDRDGHVYVIESYFDHLLVFDPSGDLLLPVGGTGGGAGQFFLPAGAWTDDGNRLFVADMFNGRVVVFDYLGDVR